MKFKIIIVLLAIIVPTFVGHSQEKNPEIYKNVFHLEAGGIGGYGSLNYERILSISKMFSLSGRLGFSTIRIYDFTTQFNPDLLFPIAINGFYGQNHKIQLGFGQIFANTVSASLNTKKPKRETNFHTHFTLGYRYQKKESRLILGISYTPILEFQKFYQHWGGLMIGFTF